MTNSVDLTNLRAMIDNDVELEKELTAEFIRGADVCFEHLSKSMDPALHEEWRRHAHALKGLALNFGAEPLGTLAKTAQEGAALALAQKQELLDAMTKEYATVKKILGH